MLAVRILAGLLFIAHGVAHWVGFAFSWRLTSSPEMPYTTRLLAGAVDVGDLGTRIMGGLWLLAGVSYLLAGVGVLGLYSWWRGAALWITLASLVLCILGLPAAKIGLALDMVILAFLLLEGRYGWLARGGA